MHVVPDEGLQTEAVEPLDHVRCYIADATHQAVQVWGSGAVYVPPFSMPFTAALEMVLSTALAASLTASVTLLRAIGVVLNRRT
jgi:hypothetical protein